MTAQELEHVPMLMGRVMETNEWSKKGEQPRVERGGSVCWGRGSTHREAVLGRRADLLPQRTENEREERCLQVQEGSGIQRGEGSCETRLLGDTGERPSARAGAPVR